MVTLLLLIIYIAFISLGLPDSALGSAWPSMYPQINVPVSYAGIISMIIAGGTIVSSLLSNKLIQKFKTGIIVAISTALTAGALVGFSFSTQFWQLCLLGVPYGLGAGSIDAALNNYVALHYKSRHMSWLHCFWGIGATLGPYIMGLHLTNNLTWQSGFRTIGLIQVTLAAILFASIPLWRKNNCQTQNEEAAPLGTLKAIKLPGAMTTMLAFFGYCALESTTGMWASTYMVLEKGISAEIAAKWASLFFIGITAGRFISGFVAAKAGDKNMIRIGQAIMLCGVVLLVLPLGNNFTLIGLVTVGLGCAPVYPAVIHSTPIKFGKNNSQALIGVQMACAYTGVTFVPPLFGLMADFISVKIYPYFIIILIIFIFVCIEISNKKVKIAKSLLPSETK